MTDLFESKTWPPDHRGTITLCDLKGVKFNVLDTKKGALRSGDYHPNTQYDLILSGKMRVTTFEEGEDVIEEYLPHQTIVIPPQIPHLFEALEDTIMIEWWDGKFETQYYKPYRDKVDAQKILWGYHNNP